MKISAIHATPSDSALQVQLPLASLRCQNCVAKLKAHLVKKGGYQHTDITLTDATLVSVHSPWQMASDIAELNYLAPSCQRFTLSGLSCGHCVQKLTNALNAQLPSAHILTLNTTQLMLITDATEQTVLEIISDLGYQAQSLRAPQSFTHSEQKREASEQTPSITNTHVAQVNASPQQAIRLSIEGMTCASCVATVEKALSQQSGVSNVRVNLAEQCADFDLADSSQLAPIQQALASQGYTSQPIVDAKIQQQEQQQKARRHYRQHLTRAVIGTGFGVLLMGWGLAGGSMMINSAQDQIGWGVIGILTFVLLLTLGRSYTQHAWQAFRHHRATMDTLIALGTWSAWLYSAAVVLMPDLFAPQSRHVYFEACAMILGLVSLGHALELRAKQRTSEAIQALLSLQPESALVIDEQGREQPMPLNQVTLGMKLRLQPGGKVAVDGIVLDGESYLDESMLTGEPLAKRKAAGDLLHAGTLNQQGSIIYQAQAVGEQTLLARIVARVRHAQTSKPKIAKLADQIAAVFVPSVMIIALLTTLIWHWFGPEPHAMYMLITGLSVLIIACPCALGLATPMSLMIGVGRAAQMGVLIRDADALQHAAKIDTIVLDKTGTLTQGKPELLSSLWSDEISEIQGLAIASTLEKNSEHPLAKAIIDGAKAKGTNTSLNAENFAAITGFGVRGEINGQTYWLGNARLLVQHQIECAARFTEFANQASSQGYTPVFIANDKQVLGTMAIGDALHEDSAQVVAHLQVQGFEVVMLTGDVAPSAKAIAARCGITQFYAECLPEDKANIIADLQKQGHHVAMVGDGMNDAPALAQANVGVAMGTGNQVAIESGQMTLLHPSLSALGDALQLSRATLKNIKQNLFGAFVYNSLGIPIAAGLLYPWTGDLLSPVVAGAAMALSSVTVVLNANRLRRFARQPSTQENS